MKFSFHNFLWLVCFCLGMVVGICTSPFGKSTDKVVETKIVYDTTRYTRLDLAKKTYRLDVPKIGTRQYVYVPSDSTKVIYRDSIRYVMLPREYRYTEADGVQIWHSGIDSTIDSLNVERKTVHITTTQTVKYKNRVSVGVEAGYSTIPYIPIYLEYGRMLHRNVEIYGKVFYDIPRMNPGIIAGVRTKFEWGK